MVVEWRGASTPPTARGGTPSSRGNRGAPPSFRGRGARGAGGGTGRGAARKPSSLGQSTFTNNINSNNDDDQDGDSGMEADNEDPPAFSGGGGGDGEAATSAVHSQNSVGRTPLEALGEDSDARKERFEANLPNNRFMEMKGKREEERKLAIQQGFLDDPLKPRSLDQAVATVGTCEEMCPEFEREEREFQNNVDVLERYPGTTRIDPSRAVKAFHRPAAGNEQPLPSDLRPPHILHQTLDYLFHKILPSHPLHVTHPFLRDRTRAVRQDLTIQNLREEEAIECNERIARYHVVALGGLRELTSFSESQELEQLRKVLKSLNEFYDDARLADPPIHAPNEAEFRSYNILTHLRDPDIIWSTESLPPHIFNDPLFQTALRLHALAQVPNIPRGGASLNAFSRFFKLLAREEVPYLFGCILSTHFGQIRKTAIETLRKAYVSPHGMVELSTLAKVLGCDGEDEVVSICEELGVKVTESESRGGLLVAELHKGVVLKAVTLKPRVSRRIVEAKRGQTSYADVIDGKGRTSGTVAPIPPPERRPSSSTSAFIQRSAPPPPTPFSTSAPSPAFPSAFAAASSSPFSVPRSAPQTSTSSAFPTSVAFPSSSKSAFGGTPIMTPESTPPPPSFFAPTPPPAAISARPPTTKLNPSASAFAPSSFAPSFASLTPPTIQTPNSATSFAPPASVSTPLQPTTLPRCPTIPAPIPQNPSPAPFSFTPEPTPPPSWKIASSQPSSLPAFSAPPQPIQLAPPAREAAPSPPPTPHPPSQRMTKALAAQRVLIDTLTSNLTQELLQHLIHLPVRRVSEDALREKWELTLRARKELRDKMVASATAELSKGFFRDVARLAAREVAFSEMRKVRKTRRVLRFWLDATVESIQEKELAAERKRRFDNVAKRIGPPSAAFVTAEEVAGNSEVDDEGMDDLDLSSLSIAAPVEATKVTDQKTAEMLQSARLSRERIWAKGTFLDTIAGTVDTTFRRQNAGSRFTFSTIVAVDSISSPFSTWLACKLDLDESSLEATMDTTFADVVVQMVANCVKPDIETLESTGLLVFDCSSILAASHTDSDALWLAARGKLHSLVANTLSETIFAPSLLVIACPPQSLDRAAEAALSRKISAELTLANLSELHSTSVLVARLEDADAQLAQHTENLLSSIVTRPEKAPVSLSRVVNPLLGAWETILRRAITFHASQAAQALPRMIEALNLIITDARSCAVRTSKESFKTLAAPSTEKTVHHAVGTYVQRHALRFALIDEALAERPPVSDARLVRLLLEHLAQDLRTTAESAQTREESVDETLEPARYHLQEHLEKTMHMLAAADVARPVLEATTAGGARKRKADAIPATTFSGTHKKERSDAGPDQDALSALSSLIKDARALIGSRG